MVCVREENSEKVMKNKRCVGQKKQGSTFRFVKVFLFQTMTPIEYIYHSSLPFSFPMIESLAASAWFWGGWKWLEREGIK
jgi:hypothetical protein